MGTVGDAITGCYCGGMSIKVDVSDIIKLEDHLERFRRQAIKFAMMNTVNDLAFESRREVLKHFDMIERNTWTRRNIAIERASTRNLISAIGARDKVGDNNGAPYLKTQEEGGVKTGKGEAGPHIPTTVASGEGRGVKPRMRQVRTRFRVTNAKLSGVRRKGKNRKQRNAIAIGTARRGGNRKMAILDLGSKGKGLFRIGGGKRNPKIDMLARFTTAPIVLKKRPWLWPNTDRVSSPANTLKIYKHRLNQQIDRLNLFS